MRAILNLFRKTLKEFSEDKVPRLAAALAYYTAFSLAPVLIIALWVVDFFYADRAAARSLLLSQVGGLAGPQAQELVQGMLEASQVLGGSVISVVIGVGALIFGASGVFVQLQDALNTIWEVTPKPNRGLKDILKERFFSFTMVLSIGFVLLVSLLISALLTAFGDWTHAVLPGTEFLLQALNFAVSFGVITVLFALIFKIVPDAQVRWRDVWPGAALTALLFTLGKFAIGLYLGNSRSLEQFGAAGSLVVLLLWVYYSAQIIFFGAEFTQVVANQYGPRTAPTPNALPLTEKDRLQAGMPRPAALAAAAENNLPVALAAAGARSHPSAVPPDPQAAPSPSPRRISPLRSLALSILMALVGGIYRRSAR